MKIYYHQLDSQLQQQLNNVYLISGDEPLLRFESENTISAYAHEQGFTEKTSYLIEQDKDIDRFLADTSTGSLFTRKRLLILQLLAGKLAAKPAKKIKALIESIDKNLVVIISMPKLEKATQSSAWVKAIEKQGTWITIYPLKENEFSTWVYKRLQQEGINIEFDVLSILVEMNSGNLLAADQQVKRLALLYPNKTITTELLFASSMDNSRYDVFQVIDFSLLAKKKELLHGFERLVLEGLKPSIVLWHMISQLKQILALSEARDRGDSLPMECNRMRLWPERQKLYTQVLARLNSNTILQLLRLCSRVDQQLKGGRQTIDMSESLKALFLYIAGSKTPSLFQLMIEQD